MPSIPETGGSLESEAILVYKFQGYYTDNQKQTPEGWRGGWVLESTGCP